MRCKRLLGGVALAAMLGAGTVQGQDIPARVHSVPATILQVLKAFDNPEGAIFSADGQSVFISNSAEIGDRGKDFGFTEGEGYISKLAMQPNGTLVIVNERLIEDLTAPLGMGVLPVATGKFPAGTIFALTGSAPMVDAQGQVVKDPTHLRTKLVAFNDNGKVLGEIDTGQGSLFEKINGSPIVLINAMGFDAEGNAYVADTAFGADQFDPPFKGKTGVWMIPHGSLDALADGKEPAEAPVFIEIPGNPDPADGGVYALTKDDIANGNLPPPVDGGLGALDGLDFTAGGAMLNTQIKDDRPNQIYVNCSGKTAATLALEPGGTSSDLTGPADIAVRRSADGPQLIVVPELFTRAANAKTDEVTVLALPAGFDAACGG
jgi:hypothetical protein